jgi:hypothetical protein
MGPFLAPFLAAAWMAPWEIRKGDLKGLFGFLYKDAAQTRRREWK